MAAQKQDDQLERTFSSYVRIWDVVLKTCPGRWTIGRSGERGSGISVLPARYDDDDDEYDKIRAAFWRYSIFNWFPVSQLFRFLYNFFDDFLCLLMSLKTSSSLPYRSHFLFYSLVWDSVSLFICSLRSFDEIPWVFLSLNLYLIFSFLFSLIRLSILW